VEDDGVEEDGVEEDGVEEDDVVELTGVLRISSTPVEITIIKIRATIPIIPALLTAAPALNVRT